MQYRESYQIQTTKGHEVIDVENFFEESEEEAIAEWRIAVQRQDKGTLVKLVRVMTVDIATSSK